MKFLEKFKKKKIVEEKKINEFFLKELPDGRAYYSGIWKTEKEPYGQVCRTVEYYSNLIIINKISEIDGIRVEDELYECELYYSKSKGLVGGYSLTTEMSSCRGFRQKENESLHVILGINKDKMKNDSMYAKFVLSELLNEDRIKKLHDNFFGTSKDPIYGPYNYSKERLEQLAAIPEDSSYGNYIGSVVEQDNQFRIVMNEKVGHIVSNSSEMAILTETYNKRLNECKVEIQRVKSESKNSIDRLTKERHELQAKLVETEEKLQFLKNGANGVGFEETDVAVNVEGETSSVNR